LSVLAGGVTGGLGVSSLQCDAVSLVLHALRGDESLDLGGLGVWFGAFLLGDDLTTNDKFAREGESASLYSEC
jgi:hypothetical protein